jgi:hypothetical protein
MSNTRQAGTRILSIDYKQGLVLSACGGTILGIMVGGVRDSSFASAIAAIPALFIGLGGTVIHLGAVQKQFRTFAPVFSAKTIKLIMDDSLGCGTGPRSVFFPLGYLLIYSIPGILLGCFLALFGPINIVLASGVVVGIVGVIGYDIWKQPLADNELVEMASKIDHSEADIATAKAQQIQL